MLKDGVWYSLIQCIVYYKYECVGMIPLPGSMQHCLSFKHGGISQVFKLDVNLSNPMVQ